MRSPFCSARCAECIISQCDGLVMHSFKGSFECLKNGSLTANLGICAQRNNTQPFLTFSFLKVQLSCGTLACTLQQHHRRAKEGQRTGHSGQLSCEDFHCTGKLGKCWFDSSQTNKAGTGGSSWHCSLFLVNLNLGIWYNAFLWLAFREGFEAAELHQIKCLQSENITCIQYLYF